MARSDRLGHPATREAERALQYPGTLALLNRTESRARLAAGTLFKRVVGDLL